MIYGKPITFGSSGLMAEIIASGDVLSTDTVTATKGSKTVNGEWVQYPNPASHNLPNGYTEVEWIQGAENAYIQLPLTNASGTNISIDFALTNADNAHTNGDRILCTRNEWLTNSYEICISGSSGIGIWCGYGSSGYNITTQSALDSDCFYNCKIENGIFTLDSVQKFTNSSSFNGNTSLCLFAINGGSSIVGNAKYTKVKHLTGNNGSTYINFIPCKNSSNIYGFYDLVNDVFYDSEGTGSFTGGNEIPRYLGYFKIKDLDLGTWLVSATREIKTMQYAVLIDEIAQYEVEADFGKRFLYSLGDECEELTGGWSSSNYPTVTKNSDNIYIAKSTTGSALDYVPTVATINTVDVTNYSKIKIELSQVNVSYASLSLRLSTIRKRTIDNDGVAILSINQGVAYSHTTFELDISSISGSYYVYVNTNSNESNTFNGNIYKVWLE